MVKVISWNIAHRKQAWHALCGTDADIALVQEATEPPADMPPAFEYRPAPWRTAGAPPRPWRAAVVKLSSRIGVQWLEPTPIEKAQDGDLTVSRAGTLDAAIVTPPTGEAFVVVSMYALWEKTYPTTASSWIYADAAVHRLISDISVFVGCFRHELLLSRPYRDIVNSCGSALGVIRRPPSDSPRYCVPSAPRRRRPRPHERAARGVRR